ncbi:hypothetical protein [Spiroplasma platyhelix]|uniref:Transmembrane protein n=1 Tax=Spiroplasma platyhelix PALS-1 TaxID=1276218 RepID=A0A846U959_9MOLU|nr:hypothetical protein [Spiroplasma platyhelix]MBE4704042.1 hypothetical protein [Spiroplasma platyhelix PALS-1]NKE38413.1 hypothetical protein [Spiroplasma platyhelix PALS-1]UJB29300.1 hypothetical protein SPLAT_v1c05360 [Spiroplasma platyhelix PALS-1]
MKKSIKARWKKINPKSLIMFDRITITVSGTLLFLIWLMFLTKNFYPKSDDNLAAVIMNWPLQASIWPISLMLLFVFIMPVWVTNSFELLSIFLFLSLLFILLSLVFLVFLNVNSLWILWLIVNLLALCNVMFALFSIYYLNKTNVKKNKSN